MESRKEGHPERRGASFNLLKDFFIFIFFTWVLTFPVRAQEITVSAAISLKEAFTELSKTFEAGQKRRRVQFNFGASGDLVRQIAGGAPVDVFASAGLKEMDELERQGLTAPGSRVNFAGNTVVLAVPAASTFRLEAFSDLTRKEVKKIAIGNPQTVPAGRYAEQVLRSLNLWEPLKDKLVFAENVRQVLDYVARGEVDAGLVYATDVASRARDLKKILTGPRGEPPTGGLSDSRRQGYQKRRAGPGLYRLGDFFRGETYPRTIWIQNPGG